MSNQFKLWVKRMPSPLEIGKYFVFIFSKMRLFKSVTSVKLNGISRKFWTPTPVLYRRAKNFGWEKQLLEAFINNIRPGDIVWDIGSFMGIYSIFASHATGGDGSVFAFEPEPIGQSHLRKNIQLNQISNLTLFDFGLNDVKQEGYIYSSTIQNIAIHSITFEPRLSGDGQLVQLQSGDQLVLERKALPPNVIKIDVEGAEARVLAGMRSLLQESNCRYLLIEVHPKFLKNFGNTIDELKTILADASFVISKEFPRNDEVHWICTKPDQ